MLNKQKKKKHVLSSGQFIILGYTLVILLGSFFLSLPAASNNGTWTNYLDSLFTATSATCVTGLVVFDTFTHWTLFGQITILLLIQIGGLGFMTIFTVFSIAFKRRIGLYERKILMQSSGSMKLSELYPLIRRILIGTLVCEVTGAALLSISFCRVFGVERGIYFAVFHAVSAFCNAGFDLMGFLSPYSSLTYFAGDWIVSLTICILIFIGGIGFLCWNDIIEFKWKFKKYQLQTKIVLTISFFLVFGSALLFFLFEMNGTLKGVSPSTAFLKSLFAAITPRTAGFNTSDLIALSNPSKILTMLLMLIGANSGSTAGGMKITTLFVTALGISSTVKNRQNIEFNKRRFDNLTFIQAVTIFIIYVSAVFIGSFVIAGVEDFSYIEILFEAISAIGTVGLSLGITGALSAVSKITLMLLMFLGRVGIITLLWSFARRKENPPVIYPEEKIQIG